MAPTGGAGGPYRDMAISFKRGSPSRAKPFDDEGLPAIQLDGSLFPSCRASNASHHQLMQAGQDVVMCVTSQMELRAPGTSELEALLTEVHEEQQWEQMAAPWKPVGRSGTSLLRSPISDTDVGQLRPVHVTVSMVDGSMVVDHDLSSGGPAADLLGPISAGSADRADAAVPPVTELLRAIQSDQQQRWLSADNRAVRRSKTRP